MSSKQQAAAEAGIQTEVVPASKLDDFHRWFNVVHLLLHSLRVNHEVSKPFYDEIDIRGCVYCSAFI